MYQYFSRNKGFTLVEVLASLLILSIVLISFFTFFTQSAKFTMHNNEKLTSVQVAEDIVGKIRANETIKLEGFSSCSIASPYTDCVENANYSSYKVVIRESKSPVEKFLKKAEILVEPTDSTIKKSYKTEIYFKFTVTEEVDDSL